MKHARKDYAHIQDPSGHIPADEPVFLLRGQDALAPELLLRYASKYRLATGTVEMANLIESHAMAMIDWQRGKHDGAKHIKLADLPTDYAERAEEIPPIHDAVQELLHIYAAIANKEDADVMLRDISTALHKQGIIVTLDDNNVIKWERTDETNKTLG